MSASGTRPTTFPPAPTKKASATRCRPPVSAPSRRWFPLPVARQQLRVVQGFVKRPIPTEPSPKGSRSERSPLARLRVGPADSMGSASRDANAFDWCGLAAAQDVSSGVGARFPIALEPGVGPDARAHSRSGRCATVFPGSRLGLEFLRKGSPSDLQSSSPLPGRPRNLPAKGACQAPRVLIRSSSRRTLATFSTTNTLRELRRKPSVAGNWRRMPPRMRCLPCRRSRVRIPSTALEKGCTCRPSVSLVGWTLCVGLDSTLRRCSPRWKCRAVAGGLWMRGIETFSRDAEGVGSNHVRGWRMSNVV